jgi:hypothetical protein
MQAALAAAMRAALAAAAMAAVAAAAMAADIGKLLRHFLQKARLLRHASLFR